MTRRRVAATGDKTTTGGQILDSFGTVNIDTGRYAHLADEVWCPACGRFGHIVQGYTGCMVDNYPSALDGYLVQCGCPNGSNRIIATTTCIFVDDNEYGDIVYMQANSIKSRAKLHSQVANGTFSAHQTDYSVNPFSNFTDNLEPDKNDQKESVKVFAKSCTVGEGCSDAAEQTEPSTNVGTMLIYGIASAFSSPAKANHPSLRPYDGTPLNTGQTMSGAAPVPVLVPTPAGPMMAWQMMPVATHSNSSVTLPSLIDPKTTLMFLLLSMKYNNVGLMVAEAFKDDVQYDSKELEDLAEIRGYAKTRVRFFFEHDKQTGQLLAHGLHTVAGTRYEEVRVRKMEWNSEYQHFSFKEASDSEPVIIWTPDKPAGSDIPANTGYPAPNNGEFNQPIIHIHPIHEFGEAPNAQGLPLLDPREINDYILVFPADSGIPPIYAYFSKVFRGDDSYKGGPIGLPKEGEITAEDIWKHITEDGDGRLTSFSEKLKSSSGSRGADYFTQKGKIVKVESADLELLSAQGVISIITKDEARKIIDNYHKKSIRGKANAAYEIMKRNNEILVHGQIPEQYIKPAK